MKKYLFITLGSISLIIGLCGIFTPGLPTTPFILLTGGLYAKSSPELYARLENNKITGRYLKRLKTGLSWKTLLFSILFMWCMTSFTAFIIFDKESTMRYVMLGLGVIGTVAQILTFRKKKPKIAAEIIKSNYKSKSEVEYVNN